MTTIADDTGELQSFNDRVSLNNFGRVAFTAFDDEFTKEAVFTGRGGPLTEVANTWATTRRSVSGAPRSTISDGWHSRPTWTTSARACSRGRTRQPTR